MTANADIHPLDVRIVPEWEFQDRLARSLRLVNLSANQLADFMGVTPTTVSRWINGHNRPNKAVLMILADMTGVDLHWLETGQAPTVESEPDEMRARRDSNPKPSVLESAARFVNRWLTVKSRPGQVQVIDLDAYRSSRRRAS